MPASATLPPALAALRSALSKTGLSADMESFLRTAGILPAPSPHAALPTGDAEPDTVPQASFLRSPHAACTPDALGTPDDSDDSEDPEQLEARHRPLENPRHEAFALALASGATPAEAYDAAGFSPKNRKARATALSEQPDIVARVDAILEVTPDIEESYWLHARPFTTMPECPDRMAVWLWQVMSGARKLKPGQMQAVKLFMRMRKWDQKDVECELSHIVPLSAGPAFTLLSNVQVARETRRQETTVFESEAEPLALTSGDALLGIDGDSYPHPQLVENQSSTPEIGPDGDNNKNLPIPLEEGRGMAARLTDVPQSTNSASPHQPKTSALFGASSSITADSVQSQAPDPPGAVHGQVAMA